MAIAKDLEPIRLSYEQGENRVVVTKKDGDRFVLTVEAAIEACEAQQRPILFREQLDALLVRLAHWLRDHRETVRTGVVTVRNNDLLFIAVQRHDRHDRAIEDALTDLDTETAGDERLSLIRLSVLALPPVGEPSMSAFVCPEHVLIYSNAD